MDFAGSTIVHSTGWELGIETYPELVLMPEEFDLED